SSLRTAAMRRSTTGFSGRFWKRAGAPSRKPSAQSSHERCLKSGGNWPDLARYPESTAVVGVDVSADILKIPFRRARTLGTREIHLSLMNVEALAFPDETFDCVVLPYVPSVTPRP